MAGYKCAKYFMVFLNVIVFLVGGLCFGAGLLFNLESGILDSDVVSLFNRIEYNNLPLGIMLEALSYIMICFGGLIMCVAILGMCGGWRGIKMCLMLYIFAIIFMIVIQAVLIGLWITIRGRADHWLRGQMLDQLSTYAGPTATDTVSSGWNKLFMKGRCCGVNAALAGTNADFATYTTWSVATEKVPATCCQGVTKDTVSNYENSATCTNVPTNFYEDGCYDTVVGYINLYSLITIIACAAVLVAEILAIVSSCVVIDIVKKNKVAEVTVGPPSQSRPPPYVAIDKFMKSRKKGGHATRTGITPS